MNVISHNLISTHFFHWIQQVKSISIFALGKYPCLVHIPGQHPLPLSSNAMSFQTRSVVKVCLYVLSLACTGLLKQIIHSASWNALNIWSWMSAGLTNIPTFWSTPPHSCTKLFHLLISFPLYSAPLLKRERPSKTCPICTAFIHQQICPLPCPSLLSSQMMKCFSLPIKNSLVWALDFILCLFFCDCPPLIKLSWSRIFKLSQTINNSKALPP